MLRFPHCRSLAVLACAAYGLGATRAAAQSSPDAPAVPPVITKATLDFGFVQTSGNTNVMTLNLGEKLTQQRGRLTFQQGFALVYGKQRDTVNTNNIRTSVRGDFRIDRLMAVFIGVGFDRNTFAGIDRRFEQQIGIQARLLAARRDTLSIEGGGSVTQQLGVNNTQQNFPAARGAVAWRHAFTPTAYFQQNAEFIPNLTLSEDWRLNAESSLIAPLSSRIGLKLSYVFRFDHLPAPGFSELDKLFTSGVQITF